MANQIYKVRDPTGAIREISGPEGATDEQVIAQAQMLFGQKPKAPIETPAFEKQAANIQSTKPIGYDIARALGQTARLGLEGATGLADTLVGAPMAMGLNKLNELTGKTARYGMPSIGGSVANAAGLPNANEGVLSDLTRAMAGAGGAAKAASSISPYLSGQVAPKVAGVLANNVGSQVAASVGGTLGTDAARESGAGPVGQFAAGLAGGMVPAALRPVGGYLSNKVGDIGATFGAQFGNERAITRIAKDAVQSERIGGNQATQNKIRDAIANRTTYAQGAAPTVGEAIAEANMNKPGVFGGATMRLQKDLSGAQGIEDIIPGALKTQKLALDAYGTQVADDAGKIRVSALSAANNPYGGVDTSKILQGIQAKLSDPKIDASDMVQKTLGAVANKITSTADEFGYIHPDRLYTIRKEIGNTISQHAKETANWDKRLSAGLERDIQKLIDKAIVDAGGTNWPEYLKTYSSGMKNIEDHLLRQSELENMQAQVKGNNAENLTQAEVPHIPNLLSRPAMITNFVLKKIVGDANTPVARRVATAMTDPQEYLKLMSAPPSDPARVLLERAMRQSVLGQAQQPQGILSEQR